MNKLHIGLLFFTIMMLTSCQKVETTSPVRKNIQQAVFASGYVEQEKIYSVAAKAEGILVELNIAEGDQVLPNQMVARLESDLQYNQLKDAWAVYSNAVNDTAESSPTLENLKTQIRQAEEQLAFDQENHQRYLNLWQKKSVSKLEYEKARLQLQNAETHLKSLQENYKGVKEDLNLQVERGEVQVTTQQIKLNDYRLASEEGGTVIDVFKKRGELVRKGEAIARIASGEYIIKLLVAEEDITKVKAGQSIAINLNTYPDQPFPATVHQILPSFDEAEQSYVVEAQFDTLPEVMFSGTQLQANILVGTLKNVLVIPTSYITNGNQIQLENGQKRTIKPGLTNGEWTVVQDGLSDGDIIQKPEL